jgi:hypothetical protein
MIACATTRRRVLPQERRGGILQQGGDAPSVNGLCEAYIATRVDADDPAGGTRPQSQAWRQRERLLQVSSE